MPLGDLPVGNWQPNSTPLYALTMDDFLASGSDGGPVKVRRKTAADAYNSIKVKFKNRGELPSAGGGGTGVDGDPPLDPLYPYYEEANQ
jgi:hypothetical protein